MDSQETPPCLVESLKKWLINKHVEIAYESTLYNCFLDLLSLIYLVFTTLLIKVKEFLMFKSLRKFIASVFCKKDKNKIYLHLPNVNKLLNMLWQPVIVFKEGHSVPLVGYLYETSICRANKGLFIKVLSFTEQNKVCIVNVTWWRIMPYSKERLQQAMTDLGYDHPVVLDWKQIWEEYEKTNQQTYSVRTPEVTQAMVDQVIARAELGYKTYDCDGHKFAESSPEETPPLV